MLFLYGYYILFSNHTRVWENYLSFFSWVIYVFFFPIWFLSIRGCFNQPSFRLSVFSTFYKLHTLTHLLWFGSNHYGLVPMSREFFWNPQSFIELGFWFHSKSCILLIWLLHQSMLISPPNSINARLLYWWHTSFLSHLVTEISTFFKPFKQHKCSLRSRWSVWSLDGKVESTFEVPAPKIYALCSVCCSLPGFSTSLKHSFARCDVLNHIISTL